MNLQTDVADRPDETVAAERTRSGRFFRPNVDILEREGELVLVADMPGVGSDGVDIRFESGELSIRGHVAAPAREGREYLHEEYATGDYFRSFRVSEQVDATRIHAECAGGVLTVHLPKAEAAKPRRIPVHSA